MVVISSSEIRGHLALALCQLIRSTDHRGLNIHCTPLKTRSTSL